MSILIDRTTPVLVQGITGKIGSFHTKEMIDYGTHVVGGVVPGRGGETVHFVQNVRRYYDILTWVTQPQMEGSQIAESGLHLPGVNKTRPEEDSGDEKL